MSKLDPSSIEKLPESVDLFNSKPTLTGIDSCALVEYPSSHPISDGPIKFHFNTGMCFADFAKSYITTKFKILKKEGKEFVPIKNSDPVSFIQGFGATFMRNIRVLFNGNTVYDGNDMYAYNAYMRRRLGLGGKINLADLNLSGFFEDELSQINGPGFEARRNLYTDGKTFETVCALDIDVFQQKKLFLNDLTVDIEISPHGSSFTLLATDSQEYKYEILECKLFVQQYTLDPNLSSSIQENLIKGSLAKYNYTKTDIKYHFLLPGIQQTNLILFTEKVPKRIFAGLIDARAFNGHIGMSPFEFAPHNLQSIEIKSNDKRVPSSAYQLNWKENNFAIAYKFLSVTTEHGISLAKYAAHSCFYAFELQNNRDYDIVRLQKSGTTAITLEFSAPVPASGLQLIVYSEFDSILSLDINRKVSGHDQGLLKCVDVVKSSGEFSFKTPGNGKFDFSHFYKGVSGRDKAKAGVPKKRSGKKHPRSEIDEAEFELSQTEKDHFNSMIKEEDLEDVFDHEDSSSFHRFGRKKSKH